MLPSRKLNVLVVDDAPTILRLVTVILERKLGDGLTVTALADPREALAWLTHNCCDLLLSDVEMPGLSGIDVVRAAKERNIWTQAIVMTAHSTTERLAAAMDSGACDYLVKPIEQEHLLEVVTACAHRAVRWQRALRGTLRSGF